MIKKDLFLFVNVVYIKLSLKSSSVTFLTSDKSVEMKI